MQLKRRVALAGVQLDSLDSRIVISGIDEGAGKENISSVSSAAGNGQRITGKRRDTLDVTVKFCMAIKNNDMQSRSTLLDTVNAWASQATNGAWLTVNHRPNKKIFVYLAQAPGGGDIYSWTNEYTITFRAFGVPYWVQDTTAFTDTGVTSLSQSYTVTGNAETVIDASFKNTSGSTCDTFSLSIGGKTIAFTSLGLANNETLYIMHGTDGLLQLTIKNTSNVYRSVMAKRTAASADDLAVMPGTYTVTMSAAKAGTISISHAGRYL